MELTLESVQQEAEKLAEKLECIDVDIDSEAAAGIIRELIAGARAETIIHDYALEEEGGV